MWSFQKNISNILNSIYVEQKVELFSVYEDELKSNYENNAKLFENKASEFKLPFLKSNNSFLIRVCNCTANVHGRKRTS